MICHPSTISSSHWYIPKQGQRAVIVIGLVPSKGIIVQWYPGFRCPDIKAYLKSGHPKSGYRVSGYRSTKIRISKHTNLYIEAGFFMRRYPDFYASKSGFLSGYQSSPDT